MLEIERMTLTEFQMRLTANKLKRLDQEYQIYLQAFVNQQAKATDKKGRSVYRSFKEFFDYEKREQEILGIETPKPKHDAKIFELLKKANS